MTVPALATVRAAGELPFAVTLAGRRWVCRELLRFLPGRRLVIRAREDVRADDADVVLKLFIGRGRRRYFRRERQGLAWLAQAGLPVPRCLAEVSERGVAGLVLEYLPDAKPVLESDQASMEIIAGYFGRLHATGFWQSDLHLPNFVRSQGTVYAVDGDGVRRWRGPLGAHRGLTNLAFLAAQRRPASDPGLTGLLGAYARERGGTVPPIDDFRRRFERARHIRIQRYLEKTRRDCTEFAVSRGFTRHTYAVRGDGAAALARVLSAAPDGLDPKRVDFLPGEVLKRGNSATVLRLPGEVPLVIKRFNIKSPLHGLRRMLRRHPRYRRAWMCGQLLTFLGVPTARPLALIEERRWLWRGVAYLVQEDLPGPDLRREVAEQGLSDRRCAEVAELFRQLRSLHLSHGDTKASNFIVHGGRLHLIDLDAMRLTERGFQADVARFLENWAPPERARFEAAFREAGLGQLV